MVIKKCHFDDLFRKVLQQIEDTFDEEFEQGFPTSLEGMDFPEVRQAMLMTMTEIFGGLWDKTYDKEAFSASKTRYERLIYEMIVFLLYLKKEEL